MLKIILFTVLGFALIMVDLVLIPGAVLVVAGSLVILYGVYLNYESYGLLPALVHLAACLALVPKLVVWSLGRVSLKNEMNSKDGYVGVSDLSKYIGIEGKAASDLRPSGSVTVMENGQEVRLDCISEGGFIEKGASVLVAESRGPSLVVRRKPEPMGTASAAKSGS